MLEMKAEVIQRGTINDQARRLHLKKYSFAFYHATLIVDLFGTSRFLPQPLPQPSHPLTSSLPTNPRVTEFDHIIAAHLPYNISFRLSSQSLASFFLLRCNLFVSSLLTFSPISLLSYMPSSLYLSIVTQFTEPFPHPKPSRNCNLDAWQRDDTAFHVEHNVICILLGIQGDLVLKRYFDQYQRFSSFCGDQNYCVATPDL
uniref:Uncharacterized protein n=1 Tax=Onchocerca volvulus TaxID=6282 RepID=A0A8R1XYH4_ONCVO